jgi:hypothetical protein
MLTEVPAQQGRLLGKDSWVLPNPRDDQTLYSWCAVYHNASGNIDAGTTSRQLFGYADAAFIPDLPSRLDFLHRATHGHLGSSETVANTRTLAGFYRPFFPEEKYQKLVSAMRGDRPGAIKAELGLSRSGIASSRILKACPECMEEEFRRWGYSYWHTEHQWPSVALCGHHHVLLWRFEPISSGNPGRHFYQPREIVSLDWVRPTASAEAKYALMRVREWSKQLVGNNELHLNEELLRWTYLLRAKQRSWIAFDGTLRLQKLKGEFSAAYHEVATLPGFAIAAETDGPNSGFLGSMFRKAEGQRHPLKHLLLLNFLFDGPEDFQKAYADHLAVKMEGGVTALLNNLTDSRSKLEGWIRTQAMSVNKAAQELDVPTGQAIKYLDNIGVNREKRPRIVGTEKEARLQQLLSKGIERGEIAKELSIRPSFIKDYLTTHPDQKAEWEQMLFARRQSRYREHFLKVLSEHPGLPIKAIRRIPSNGFQWLYCNDLEWLSCVLPAIWKRP